MKHCGTTHYLYNFSLRKSFTIIVPKDDTQVIVYMPQVTKVMDTATDIA